MISISIKPQHSLRFWPHPSSIFKHQFVLFLIIGLVFVQLSQANQIQETLNKNKVKNEKIVAYNSFIQGDLDLPEPGSSQAIPNPVESEENHRRETPSDRLHSSSTKASSQDAPRVILAPQSIDFSDKPISIRSIENLSISNTDSKTELLIQSVTVDNPNFHVSFFKPISISPLHNSSLEIAFLPRSLGFVDGSLVLHTSMGTFIIQLSGRGIPNPYKISPFVGVKVPIGAVYEPNIVLYNPHYEILSVNEIFTSCGFLHLQLPQESMSFKSSIWEGDAVSTNHSISAQKSNQKSRQLRFWDIKPHERQTVIKLHFLASKTGKFQGYVNITTNFDTIILQVEVSVVQGSLYRTPEELDFGIITTMQDSKTLDITLLNSGDSAVQVSDLQLATADPSITMDFVPTILQAKKEVILTHVTYSVKASKPNNGEQSMSSQASSNQDSIFRGKLLLRTNDSNPVNSRMEIPYHGKVLTGHISYPSSQNIFPSFKLFDYYNAKKNSAQSNGDKKATEATIDSKSDQTDQSSGQHVVQQELVLTNKFQIPVTLFSVEIEDISFRIVDFSSSVTADPGESWPSLKIFFYPSINSNSMFSTHLNLYTNISILSIPIHVYHGRLSYTLPGSIEVGTKSSSDKEVEFEHDSSSKDSKTSKDFSSKDSKTSKDSSADSFTLVSKHKFSILPSTSLDFGVIPVKEVQTKTINITNHNPVKVSILALWSDVEGLSIKLESLWNSQGYRQPTNLDFLAKKPAFLSSKSVEYSKPSDSSESSSKQSSKTEEAFEIEPGYSAVFSVEVTSSKESDISGFVYIATTQERSAIRVNYQSLEGNLVLYPERLLFDEDLSQVAIYAEHSYSKTIRITSITSSDMRIEPILSPKLSSLIGSQDERHLWLRPHTRTQIGMVSFDPLKSYSNHHDLNRDNLESDGSSSHNRQINHPHQTFSETISPFILSDVLFDHQIESILKGDDLKVNTLNQQSRGKASDIRAIFTVRTDLNTVQTFPIRVSQAKQSILKLSSANSTQVVGKVRYFAKSSKKNEKHSNEKETQKESKNESSEDLEERIPELEFGILQVKSSQASFSITLKNPSSQAILAQLLLSETSTLNTDSSSSLESQESLKSERSNYCENSFSFGSDSIKLGMIPAGSTKSFGPIVFSPHVEGLCTQKLYILNNLTTLESLILSGTGGSGQLVFEAIESAPKLNAQNSIESLDSKSLHSKSLHSSSSKSLHSSSSDSIQSETSINTIHQSLTPINELTFVLEDDQLDVCEQDNQDKKESLKLEPISFQKEILLSNKGNLPLEITSLSVDGRWRKCSYGGFTIEDCSKFVLSPQQSRSLKITFSPDFSASVVEHDLLLSSSTSDVFKIPMKATMSHTKLAACASKFRSQSIWSKSSNLSQDVKKSFIAIAMICLVVLLAILAKDYMYHPTSTTGVSFGSSPSSAKFSSNKSPKNKSTIMISFSNDNLDSTEDVENHKDQFEDDNWGENFTSASSSSSGSSNTGKTADHASPASTKNFLSYEKVNTSSKTNQHELKEKKESSKAERKKEKKANASSKTPVTTSNPVSNASSSIPVTTSNPVSNTSSNPVSTSSETSSPSIASQRTKSVETKTDNVSLNTVEASAESDVVVGGDAVPQSSQSEQVHLVVVEAPPKPCTEPVEPATQITPPQTHVQTSQQKKKEKKEKKDKKELKLGLPIEPDFGVPLPSKPRYLPREDPNKHVEPKEGKHVREEKPKEVGTQNERPASSETDSAEKSANPTQIDLPGNKQQDNQTSKPSTPTIAKSENSVEVELPVKKNKKIKENLEELVTSEFASPVIVNDNNKFEDKTETKTQISPAVSPQSSSHSSNAKQAPTKTRQGKVVPKYARKDSLPQSQPLSPPSAQPTHNPPNKTSSKDYSKDHSRDYSKDHSKDYSKDNYSKDFSKDHSKDHHSKDHYSKDYTKKSKKEQSSQSSSSYVPKPLTVNTNLGGPLTNNATPVPIILQRPDSHMYQTNQPLHHPRPQESPTVVHGSHSIHSSTSTSATAPDLPLLSPGAFHSPSPLLGYYGYHTNGLHNHAARGMPDPMPSNFEFSMAPSFDLPLPAPQFPDTSNSSSPSFPVSNQQNVPWLPNHFAPPSRDLMSTTPTIPLYNPLASTGSVESLFAGLREPGTPVESGYDSAASTPRDYSAFINSYQNFPISDHGSTLLGNNNSIIGSGIGQLGISSSTSSAFGWTPASPTSAPQGFWNPNTSISSNMDAFGPSTSQESPSATDLYSNIFGTGPAIFNSTNELQATQPPSSFFSASPKSIRNASALRTNHHSQDTEPRESILSRFPQKSTSEEQQQIDPWASPSK